MFNYGEIDRYITTNDLSLVTDYLKTKGFGSYMISGVERINKGVEYKVYLTCAQHGYTLKYRIENGKVEDLGVESSWMS
jgi:hypothetical protein